MSKRLELGLCALLLAGVILAAWVMSSERPPDLLMEIPAISPIGEIKIYVGGGGEPSRSYRSKATPDEITKGVWNHLDGLGFEQKAERVFDRDSDERSQRIELGLTEMPSNSVSVTLRYYGE